MSLIIEDGFLGIQQINNALDVVPNPATGDRVVSQSAGGVRDHSGRVRPDLRALEHLADGWRDRRSSSPT